MRVDGLALDLNVVFLDIVRFPVDFLLMFQCPLGIFENLIVGQQ